MPVGMELWPEEEEEADRPSVESRPCLSRVERRMFLSVDRWSSGGEELGELEKRKLSKSEMSKKKKKFSFVQLAFNTGNKNETNLPIRSRESKREELSTLISESKKEIARSI